MLAHKKNRSTAGHTNTTVDQDKKVSGPRLSLPVLDRGFVVRPWGSAGVLISLASASIATARGPKGCCESVTLLAGAIFRILQVPRWMVLLTAFLLGSAPVATRSAAAQQTAWEQWQHQPGIVELGTRGDASLVAMAAGRLFSVTAGGAVTPFSIGPDGFTADPGAEPYFVVAQASSVENTPCSWTADDLFVLDLMSSPPGLARVDTAGRVSRFATLGGVDTFGGIALDNAGSFGHRLLVTGTHNGNQTTVFAVDCQGASTTLTDSAPQVEGGIAVAPVTFGQFAGALIAPDENTGQVWAIDPSGKATVVAVPALPTGGDTGVESVGFVPPGFIGSNSYAYLADRGTPNNPFPGTDSILRVSAAVLGSAGVQDGDLLVATEGNGTTVAIRCAETCTTSVVAQGPNGGHIEGHIVFATPS